MRIRNPALKIAYRYLCYGYGNNGSETGLDLLDIPIYFFLLESGQGRPCLHTVHSFEKCLIKLYIFADALLIILIIFTRIFRVDPA
jgi:hypothetical protein